MSFINNIFIKKRVNKVRNANELFLLANRSNYNVDIESFLSTAYLNPFIATAFEVLTRGMHNLDWGTNKKNEKNSIVETKLSFISNTLCKPSMLTNQDEFMTYIMLYYILDGECLIRRIRLADKYDLIVYKKSTYQYELLDMDNTIKLTLSGSEEISENEMKDFYLLKNTNIYSLIGGAGEGRSMLESLSLLHDFYCLIMTWNNDLLKNDGASPYAIISPDYMQEDSKKEILDKYIRNTRKKGLPLIFEGSNLSIQHLSNNSPKDFDYLGALDEIRNMTANVLGVPSILLGDRTNQKFSNYKEAKKALYTETILPIAEKIRLALADFLADELETNEEIFYNCDRVEVLQEDKNEKIKMLASLNGVLTINELRKEIGYDPVEGGDELLLDKVKIPLDRLSDVNANEDNV